MIDSLLSWKPHLKGKIAQVTVGHIPRELSWHTWYPKQEGEYFEAVKDDVKANLSPLLQGGLEIPMV